MHTPDKSFWRPRHPAPFLLFSLGIFLTALISYKLNAAGEAISPVWLPSGIAFAVLFRFGLNLWPGILLGMVPAALVVFKSPLPGFEGAFWTTIETLLGAWALKYDLKADRRLEKVRDVVLFFLIAVLITPFITSASGSLGMSFNNRIPPESVLFSFIGWWTRDAMGILLFAPLLLTFDLADLRNWTRQRVLEGSILFLLLYFGITLLINNLSGEGLNYYPLAFIPFPLLMWAALRFGQPGASLAVILVSTMALVNHLLQFEAGKHILISVELINLWIFIGLVAGTAYLVAALNANREQAERELKSQKELLRNVIDNMDLEIAVKEKSGKYLLVNEKFARKRGHTVESMTGLRDADIYPFWLETDSKSSPDKIAELFPEYLEGWRREEAEIIQNPGKILYNETTHLGKDGVNHFQLHRKKAIFLKETSDHAILLTVEQMDKLRHTEARLKFALEGGDLCLWDWDLANHQFQFEENWNAMMGQDPEAGHSRQPPWQDCLSPDENTRITADLERHFKGESPRFTCEFPVFDKDDREIWLFCQGRVVARDTLGKPIRMSGTVNAITDRKNAQLALEKAKEEAEKANREKSRFLAHMSHEIRTPMNVVIGMTSVLIDQPLEDDLREGLETIRKAGNSLLDLINDILDISKIESGKLQFNYHEFSLPKLVEEVAELFKNKSAQKNLELKTRVGKEVPPYVVGDVFRLRQILVNLTDNAIKFTAAGEVDIKVDLDENPARQKALESSRNPFSKDEKTLSLHFRVLDTGIGVPPGREEEIFKAFQQADSSMTRQYGGSGLGLAISKRMAEAMGGEMWVENNKTAGATFHFTILAGYGEIQEEEGMPSRVEEEPSRFINFAKRYPCRILLAEDNPANQFLALQMLKKFGYRIDTAWNGREVLEAVEARTYDLIFMDVEMPEMDGLKVTAEIRKKWPQTPRRPYIVAMTAYALPSDRKRCFASGMNDFLAKPVTPMRMRQILSRLFEGEGARDA